MSQHAEHTTYIACKLHTKGETRKCPGLMNDICAETFPGKWLVSASNSEKQRTPQTDQPSQKRGLPYSEPLIAEPGAVRPTFSACPAVQGGFMPELCGEEPESFEYGLGIW